MRWVENWAVGILFILILSILFINQQFAIFSDAAYNENRQKVEKPAFDLNALDNYPHQYELYLKDNFSFRGLFLKYMGKINYNLLNKSPQNDKLIIGEDDWLYSVDKELALYMGNRKMTNQEMELVLKEFLRRDSILSSLGIDMYVYISPTKYSVYPEHLPGYLKSAINNNGIGDLVTYFNDHSSIKIIYGKDELIKHKAEHKLYYKGDNHWNELGGFFASTQILQFIKLDHPEIPIYFLDDYKVDTVIKEAGNLANMTGFGNDFKESDYKLKLKTGEAFEVDGKKYPCIEGFPYPWVYQKRYASGKNHLPKVVFIRDSFGHALIPSLKYSFNQSFFLFDSWQYKLNLDIIKEEHANIVVFEMLESLITPQKFE